MSISNSTIYRPLPSQLGAGEVSIEAGRVDDLPTGPDGRAAEGLICEKVTADVDFDNVPEDDSLDAEDASSDVTVVEPA